MSLPLSNDTEKRSSSHSFDVTKMFHDIRVTKNWILQIFTETAKFQIFNKNHTGFQLIMKENDINNIQRKFQVHSINIFGLGTKTNIVR